MVMIQWLKCRQTSRSLCGVATAKIVRSDSRAIVHQSISCFFPAIGSIRNAVILGYTSCGNQLVVVQNGYIVLFSLVLCARAVSIGPVHRKMRIRSASEVAKCPAVVEVVLLRSIPQLVAVMVVSVEECASQNKVMCGRLRVFLHERMIINEDSLSCTFRHNAMYAYGDCTDDAVVLLNTGSSLTAYLVLHIKKSELPIKIQDSAKAWAIMIRCNDLQSFSARSRRWHLLSSAEHNDAHSGLRLTTVRSVVNLELFSEEYLHFLHPAAYQRGSQFDLEFRVIGPCDSGVDFLCVLGLSFTHLQAGLQSVGVLIVINPLVDQIAVIKVCDLASLCKQSSTEFSVFRRQLRVKRVSEDVSWLSSAVDYYSRIVHTSYSSLLFGRTCGRDASALFPFTVLSNINMVLNGESLTQLVHPFLPVVVVNDEQETQNEEILFSRDYMY